jgi:hypothetical protein
VTTQEHIARLEAELARGATKKFQALKVMHAAGIQGKVGAN